MTNDELNEIWIEAETQGSVHRLNAQALIVEVRRLQAENARLAKLNTQHIGDLVDDDDRVRASCARVLPQSVIDGDSYSVPGIADLCEMVVARCEQLAKDATNNIILPV